MRHAIRYIVATLGIILFLCQIAVSLNGFWSLGFSRETWRTSESIGRHRNIGAVLTAQALFIFFESEQHPVPANGETWFPKDYSTLDTAGSPPQFTVSDTHAVTDWMIGWTGYRYSVRSKADWQGQYHLIALNPIIVLGICAIAIALALRAIFRSWARRRRTAQGCCPNCGYDLRAGHERCPECGIAVTAKDLSARTVD